MALFQGTLLISLPSTRHANTYLSKMAKEKEYYISCRHHISYWWMMKEMENIICSIGLPKKPKKTTKKINLFSNIPFLIVMYHMHKAPSFTCRKHLQIKPNRSICLRSKPHPCVAMTSLQQRQEGCGPAAAKSISAKLLLSDGKSIIHHWPHMSNKRFRSLWSSSCNHRKWREEGMKN